MKVDLLHGFVWDELCEALDHQLGQRLGSGGTHRVYPGLSSAVFELVLGTGIFYSHKKHYACLTGDTWAYDAIIPNLLKDGFQPQVFRGDQIEDPVTWVSSLSKETGFVIWSEDHPILGTYNSRDDLDKALNDQRIISIRVSHNAFLYKSQEIRPYSVRICSLGANLTVAQTGSRFKSPPLFVHRQAWDLPSTLKSVLVTLDQVQGNQSSENQTSIEKFEAQFEGSEKSGLLSKLPIQGQRLFDRALIFHPKLNAEAILQNVASQNCRQVLAPGLEGDFETINRCRWQPAPAFDRWWEPRPGDQVLAGLMILSVKAVQNAELTGQLLKAVQQSQFTSETSV